MNAMRTREPPYVEDWLAKLREEFPTHYIWVVPKVIGPNDWCSRPNDHPISTIVTDSPEKLRKRIKDELALAERRSSEIPDSADHPRAVCN